MDNDNVNPMNIDLVKYPEARLFMPKMNKQIVIDTNQHTSSIIETNSA